MVFKYRELKQTKYKDIKSSRWIQRVSLNQSVQEITHPPEKVLKKKLKRKKPDLNVENQLYLQKRLKTESFV